jgi:cell division protein FtsQ
MKGPGSRRPKDDADRPPIPTPPESRPKASGPSAEPRRLSRAADASGLAPPPSNRRIERPAIPRDVLDELDPSERDAAPGAREMAAAKRIPVAATPSKLGDVVRAVFGGALVVAVSVGVAWAARRHVVGSARFAVTDIVVNGAKRRTADEVETEAGIARGQNVFTVDLDRVRARLLNDPWIAEATLGRRLPGTILVQITEREAGAIVALTDSYLASRDGEIFKRLEPSDPTDLPIITGITSDQVAEDRDGVTAMIRRAQDLASDYEHGPLADRAPLEEIHLGREGSVSLVVGKDGVGIALGGPPFRRKLDEAARVFSELDRRGAKADTIMIDNEARPDRVVVRMR